MPTSSQPDDYDLFCMRLKRLAGIDLHQYKRQQMERRLRTHIQRRGTATLEEYAARVTGDPGELTVLLDRLTINVSQLFRNPEQWETIRDQLLPELSRGGAPVRAWSAGCSYGAEAYSLAALMRELRIPGSILASDIDEAVLRSAAAGEFTHADARSAPSELMERWFRPTEGGWAARNLLRELITVQRENLLELPARPAAFDLVLCRNVVIYFTTEAREQVHEGLARSLRPGGYLVIGSTERITQDLRSLRLVPIQPFIYRKA